MQYTIKFVPVNSTLVYKIYKQKPGIQKQILEDIFIKKIDLVKTNNHCKLPSKVFIRRHR